MIEADFLKDSFGSYHAAESTQFDEKKELAEALAYAQEANVVVMAVGEHYLQSGEGGKQSETYFAGSAAKAYPSYQGIGQTDCGRCFQRKTA